MRRDPRPLFLILRKHQYRMNEDVKITGYTQCALEMFYKLDSPNQVQEKL